MSNYLLCETCEQRFRRLGEDWMMANCYRDEGTFRLRDLLRNAKPLSDRDDIQVYEGAFIPGLDVDAMIYFAMSVVWRAACHRWRFEGRDYQISLGPYEERFRQFLLGRGAFPNQVVMSVRISGSDNMLQTAFMPQAGNGQGFHFYKFALPGVMFLLLVGGRIPEEYLRANTAPAPERYISIHPKSEHMDFMEMAELVQSLKR